MVTFPNLAGIKGWLDRRQLSVSGNILPGPGPIRTLRISAFSSDFTPLSGSGTLVRSEHDQGKQHTLRARHWSGTPHPDDFIFIDANLETYGPGSTPPGSITNPGTTINISGNISLLEFEL